MIRFRNHKEIRIMKLTKNARGRFALAGLLVAGLVLSAPSLAQDIEWIDEILSSRFASVLAANAAEVGETILPETLSTSASRNDLVLSARLERTAAYSLDDLAAGLDLEYLYWDTQDDIPAGYYTHRIEVEDPTQFDSGSTHTLISRDGEVIGKGAGDYAFLGIHPDPGDARTPDCESSTSWGIDEQGDQCINMVTVCTEGSNVTVLQTCLKLVE